MNDMQSMSIQNHIQPVLTVELIYTLRMMAEMVFV